MRVSINFVGTQIRMSIFKKYFIHWWQQACAFGCACLIIAAIITTAVTSDTNVIIGLWATSNALVYIYLFKKFGVRDIVFCGNEAKRPHFFEKHQLVSLVLLIAHSLLVSAIGVSIWHNKVPLDAIKSLWGLSVLFLLSGTYLLLMIHTDDKYPLNFSSVDITYA